MAAGSPGFRPVTLGSYVPLSNLGAVFPSQTWLRLLKVKGASRPTPGTSKLASSLQKCALLGRSGGSPWDQTRYLSCPAEAYAGINQSKTLAKRVVMNVYLQQERMSSQLWSWEGTVIFSVCKPLGVGQLVAYMWPPCWHCLGKMARPMPVAKTTLAGKDNLIPGMTIPS